MRASRSKAAIAALLVGVAPLAGCTSAVPGDDPTAVGEAPVPTGTAEPAGGGSTAEEGKIPAAGTEVAGGRFLSASGTATGQVSLHIGEAGDIDVRFNDDFSVPAAADLRVYLVPGLVGPDDAVFRHGSFQLELGSLTSRTGSQNYRFGLPWSWGEGDPSFLRTLAIVSYQALREDASAVAVAPLTWTYPEPRTVRVVDSGATGGARGDVDVADAVPVSYTVAPNDLIAEIAARFGVSVRDLLWLNPLRGRGEAIAGEELNLSPAER